MSRALTHLKNGVDDKDEGRLEPAEESRDAALLVEVLDGPWNRGRRRVGVEVGVRRLVGLCLEQRHIGVKITCNFSSSKNDSRTTQRGLVMTVVAEPVNRMLVSIKRSSKRGPGSEKCNGPAIMPAMMESLTES